MLRLCAVLVDVESRLSLGKAYTRCIWPYGVYKPVLFTI